MASGETAAEAVAAVCYFVLMVIPMYRLCAVHGFSPLEKKRVFHLLLAAFAAVRFVFTIIILSHPSKEDVPNLKVVLSRIALCIFFSMFTHVAASWCVRGLSASCRPTTLAHAITRAPRRPGGGSPAPAPIGAFLSPVVMVLNPDPALGWPPRAPPTAATASSCSVTRSPALLARLSAGP